RGSRGVVVVLGGRDGHLLFPAGPLALTAGGRRGTVIYRELPKSAARAADWGITLYVRRVGGLDPPQGLERGPGLAAELRGDELHLFNDGKFPHTILERGHTASANLNGVLQQFQTGVAIPVFRYRSLCDPDQRVSGRGARGFGRHSGESPGAHRASVDALHARGDQQVRTVCTLRHGA